MSKELYIFLAILIMAIVTYIPRAIPISFMKHEIKNKYVKSFLFYVPYAVLSCLTFPGVLYFTSNIWIALAGTATALILSFFNQKLPIVALASVLVVFGLSFIPF